MASQPHIYLQHRQVLMASQPHIYLQHRQVLMRKCTCGSIAGNEVFLRVLGCCFPDDGEHTKSEVIVREAIGGAILGVVDQMLLFFMMPPVLVVNGGSHGHLKAWASWEVARGPMSVRGHANLRSPINAKDPVGQGI